MSKRQMPYLGGSDPVFMDSIPRITLDTPIQPYAVARSRARNKGAYERVIVLGYVTITGGTPCQMGDTQTHILFIPEQQKSSGTFQRTLRRREFNETYVVERYCNTGEVALRDISRINIETSVAIRNIRELWGLAN